LIDLDHEEIPICRQCELLGLPRSSLYYRSRGDNGQDQALMRLIDEQYTQTPFYGSRRMTAWLANQGFLVNRKRVSRLMRRMGIEAIYPKKRLSLPDAAAKKYPYLLRDMAIDRPDQVWAADITYIRMKHGFIYLVAIMDWFSRYVLAWGVSITMDVDFCVEALGHALGTGKPEIFNTDQGSQFTSRSFTGVLEAEGVMISMDGERTGIRQHLCGASLALGQVRGGVSQGVRNGQRSGLKPQSLLWLLQSEAFPSGSRVQDPVPALHPYSYPRRRT